MYIPVRIPDGSTLTAYDATLTGATGHGALPGNMPFVQLINHKLGDSPDVSTGAFDTAASVGAFEVAHTMGESGLSVVASNSDSRMYIYMLTESGTSALAGAIYYSPSVTYTTTRLDEGGA